MSIPTKYNKVTIYGESYIDYLWIVDRVMTEEEINNHKLITYKPEWDVNTILLANFDLNINGGNIVSLTENVESWIVYRKKKDETKLTFVQKIPATQNYVTDYGVANQTEYQYAVFPETLNTLGISISSDIIQTNWWNWSVTDIKQSETNENLYYADTNNVWLFDMNLNSNTSEQVLDKHIYDGFAKFPKMSVGKRNYAKGSVNCLLGNMKNYLYNDTVEMQNKFKEFINNGNQKLLKDRKGNIYIVDITSTSFDFIDEVSSQPITVSFEWIQIGDIEDISVVGES